MTVTYLPATQGVHDEATRQNFEYIESYGVFGLVRGAASTVWPGGGAISSKMSIPHGLGRAPDPNGVMAIASGDFAPNPVMVWQWKAPDATNIYLQAFCVVPGAVIPAGTGNFGSLVWWVIP